MTDEVLAQIEARANAATEGPWETRVQSGEAGVRVRAPNHRPNEGSPWLVCSYPVPPDAEFIAHARDDVPALLAEVKRLRAAVEAEQDLGSYDW